MVIPHQRSAAMPLPTKACRCISSPGQLRMSLLAQQPVPLTCRAHGMGRGLHRGNSTLQLERHRSGGPRRSTHRSSRSIGKSQEAVLVCVFLSHFVEISLGHPSLARYKYPIVRRHAPSGCGKHRIARHEKNEKNALSDLSRRKTLTQTREIWARREMEAREPTRPTPNLSADHRAPWPPDVGEVLTPTHVLPRGQECGTF